ncbi:MAG: hypothetical protein M0R21_08435 [Lentimicrobiaceae bacterium]|nr:hypothetical protein [Lentimicrobiaceae bacterium]
MEENPWINLIHSEGNYYLDIDHDNIIQNNDDYENDSENENYVDLRYIPEPFIGNIEAQIYFLLANPGRTADNEELELNNLGEHFIDASINNLNHNLNNYPFLYLNPDFEHTEGYRWWNRCLNPIITHLNIDRQLFASSFFAIEIYGYHTRQFNSRFINNNLWLTSIDYTVNLIRNAIHKNKLILISRSVRNWFNLVEDLRNYQNCYFVANNRQMEISQYTIPPIVINGIMNRINGA